MTRPLYQNSTDSQNEESIVDLLMVKWRYDSKHKLPISYGIDYALLCNRAIAQFVECKDRPRLPFNYGDGYYIAVQKVIKARQLTAITKVPCLLAVRLSDGLVRVVDFTALHQYHTIIHGRSDRDDPADYEPCAIYPWAAFELVGAQDGVAA